MPSAWQNTDISALYGKQGVKKGRFRLDATIKPVKVERSSHGKQHLMALGCEGHFPLTLEPPGQLHEQVPPAEVQADSCMTSLPPVASIKNYDFGLRKVQQ